jgi:hypothetical protein
MPWALSRVHNRTAKSSQSPLRKPSVSSLIGGKAEGEFQIVKKVEFLDSFDTLNKKRGKAPQVF